MSGAEAGAIERFIEAQDRVWPAVVRELSAGRKTSHWMWFVFPQIAGLGSSFMAQKYAIPNAGEATAYLRHTVLGPRLREVTALVMAVDGRDLHAIFGDPDDKKFRSSMTLFDAARPDNVFARALDKYCDGARDAATLAILRP